MKRASIELEAIADFDNLARAFWRAAKGSPHAREALEWQARLERELSSLRVDILRGSLELGHFRRFPIRDPKPRVIHAPCFRERVVHHAVMARVGPVLERAMIADTYACRVGKGAHAAVARAQEQLRRYPCYAQIDIRAYFASIRHDRLKSLLRRRLKGRRVLSLLDRIIDCHHDSPGAGLPIGALTSQHLANYYLSGLDRVLLERLRVLAMVRYMDDVVWWNASPSRLRGDLEQVEGYLRQELSLGLKPAPRIAPSQQGLRFCGFRVFPGTLQLTRRRMRRYALARRKWEDAHRLGLIDARLLQQGYASAAAITAHADAAGFRRIQLERVPVRFEC